MFIYSWLILSSLILSIVKERAAKPVNIAGISAPAFFLNIYY
jgi:hypothetical protein